MNTSRLGKISRNDAPFEGQGPGVLVEPGFVLGLQQTNPDPKILLALILVQVSQSPHGTAQTVDFAPNSAGRLGPVARVMSYMEKGSCNLCRTHEVGFGPETARIRVVELTPQRAVDEEKVNCWLKSRHWLIVLRDD